MTQIKPAQKRRNDEAHKRDVFGRNLSYIHSCLPNIGEVDGIDLYSHDLESGYSPLHVTLKNGYLQKSYMLYKRWKDDMEFLSHKYGGHILNQVDREGLKPLELYDMEFQSHITQHPKYFGYGKNGSLVIGLHEKSSVASFGVRHSFMSLPEDEIFENTLRKNGGSHILTLGSNVNYQLGTGTKDDRQNMFQLGVHQFDPEDGNQLESMSFKKVLMTRYHSLVLTSTNKIYTCGNSSRGRLGNGITDAPQISFKEILNLGDSGVAMLVSSNHHSLVLTYQSEVYSWGWNGYGQLGYPTSSKAGEEKLLEKVCGSKPKRISFFDDKDIVSIACSKVHSCAVARNGTVYLWGLNLGQMGGSKPSHLTPDVEYQTQEGYIISSPICINLSHLTVQQVVCTDFATFIRSKNNTLHVYSNYMTRTFKIPLPRAKTFKEVDAFAHFAPREVPSEVLDMKCSNSFGNNICFKYSCGRIGMISVKDESSKMWTKFLKYLPVSLCWMPNFKAKKCFDFAVSSKGSLIISTFGGEVFTCTGTNFMAERMYSNKLVSGRSINVSCDPSFGSFAIIKNERFEVPMIYPKDNLLYDFSQYSPLYGISRTPTNTIWGISNTGEFKLSNYLRNFEFDQKNDELAETSKSHREKFSLMPFSSDNISDTRANHESSDFDVTIVDSSGKTICKCHRLILLMRCPRIKQSLMNDGRFSTKDASLQLCLDSKYHQTNWTIQAHSIQISPKNLSIAVEQIIHFLYTDEKLPSQILPKLLLDIMDNSYHLTKIHYCLQQLLNTSSEQNEFWCLADVVLQMKDGVLHAHSLILSSRCLFFQVALKKEWRTINEKGMAFINMNDISSASTGSMTCILKYMYGVPYDEIFDNISRSQETEITQFFLDVLELCDELNIECFKNYVESVAVRYISGETVVPILINAVASNSRLLALNCCWFLCSHVGLLFTSDNADLIEKYFDSVIWGLIENTLRDLKNTSVRVDHISWYEDSSIDWKKLFKTNLSGFNEHFMNYNNAFIPVIDLKIDDSETLGLKNNKKPSRRRSSNHSFSKSRQSSFVNGDCNSVRRPSVASIVEAKPFWKSGETIADGEAVLDTEEFIEVVKKPKRKSSNQVPPQAKTLTIPTEPAGKVVVHKPNESTGENLPSLLVHDGPSSSLGLGESDAYNFKITGMFKKGSQKQRRKQLTEQDGKKDTEVAKKTPWGNAPLSAALPTGSTASSNGRKSLPSLYDNGSTTDLIQTKREKKKMSWNNPTNTEFVSHGNLGGITPYVHRVSMAKSTISASKAVPNDPQPDVKPKLSLEERVAQEEFEKWFAQESAKVQKKLKNDKHKARDEMRVMYNAADNLPDFVTGGDEQSSKRGKRLKLKFSGKHKNKDDSFIRTLP